ncbi:MAG: F0F1 ATP synthase subunit gamma [Anaplasma sp.]
MVSLKALSLRIRSVRSIQKTTRVMQMISASKLRAAREGLLCAREYRDLVQREAEAHRCLVSPGKCPKGTLVLVFSSDRGLCGGFNYAIAKFLRTYATSEEVRASGEKLHFLFIGKKAREIIGDEGIQALGEVFGVFPQPKGRDIFDFKCFLYGLGADFARFSKVVALYTKFYSASRQEPVAEDLLVVKDPEALNNCSVVCDASDDGVMCGYEPEFSSVSAKLCMSRFLGGLYLSLRESLACEHCCRMIAMESANSNTKSMLNRLLLEYNRSRQAAITTDLIEVVGGCEALG